jgi:tyrosinase
MTSRRHFLQSSLTVALLPLVPRVARSTDLSVRPSWDVFCASPGFMSLCNGIRLMRANKNAVDPASWAYWVGVHKQFCPHRTAYFLAWHRGLLYHFEDWLRRVSGDPTLVLPYWNYYANPKVPPEFLDPAQPLYRSGRIGDDVTGALSLDPFADTVTHFQRGRTDSFEVAVETRPHNPVHNLIGGTMASISISPGDPLFWVHHANIDRLWAAWVAAGNGRKQPLDTNTYWTGSFQYGAAIAELPRVWTSTTSNYLGYHYDDETLPTTLPVAPPPATSTASAATFSLASATPLRPQAGARVRLGHSLPLSLDEHSTSVDVELGENEAARVRSLLMQPATDTATTTQGDSLRVVLDGVRLTGLGRQGGYFYKVCINLPERAGANRPERTYVLGLLGPFEIDVAQMKARMAGGSMQGMHDMQAGGSEGVRLVFPVTEALRASWPTQLDTLSVSFVRVDGRRRPLAGETIAVKAFRVEADPTP